MYFISLNKFTFKYSSDIPRQAPGSETRTFTVSLRYHNRRGAALSLRCRRCHTEKREFLYNTSYLLDKLNKKRLYNTSIFFSLRKMLIKFKRLYRCRQIS